MKYAVEKVSYAMINSPSFMKSGIGIKAILKFGPNELRGRNIGTADGRDLCSMQLRWAQMP
jgi:hypothetical protein